MQRLDLPRLAPLARRLRITLYGPRTVRACNFKPEKEFPMDWNRVQGNWKQLRGKVKEKWGKLTDDQLDVIAGRREQLLGRIQEQYGITKDEAERQMREFEDRFDAPTRH
jgi:uncharacterized protein YjbJ (UPF0337 family)